MDWFSWLSRTGLDPLRTYQYGLLFVQNGLKPEDIPSFNHDFLHKIGISVATDRLEIMKLAKFHREQRQPTQKKLLLSAFTRTKNCLRNCLRKLILTANSKPGKAVFRKEAAEIAPDPTTHGEDFSRKQEVLKPTKRRSKNVSHSGPLDGRTHEKLMMNGKCLKLSGPLDRKERPMFPRSPISSGPLEGRTSSGASSKSPKFNGAPQGRMMRLIPPSRSPRVSGPLDGSPRICCRCKEERIETDDDYHSLWVSLFYDIKPV